ncbi:MAG: restriction endonuclease subunit S [Bacteroidales bacterium]|nr:restriction endonuclease subunit S [Bacteroidales bacterium]
MKHNANNTKPFYNTTIPSDWEILKLGNIGEFKNGINKDKEEFGYGYPFVGLMDVFDIPKVYNGDFSLVNSTENERKDFDLQKGDVLFVRSSVKPIGVGLTTLVCQDMPETTFSGFLIRFRANGKFDFEFKAHCFYESNFRNRLLKKSTISANTNINQVALKSLKIALPPLPEQRAIAHLLSLMDTAINKNNQLIAQKELRKKWLMQNLLTRKKRLKGYSGVWKTKTLKNILTIAGKPFIPEKEKLYTQIGIRSHTKGIFYKERVTGASLGEKRVFWIEPDCFVVNIVFAWEHAIAKTTEQEVGMIASHRFPMYKPKESILTLDYLLYYFKSPMGKYLLGLASPGGAGRNKTLGKSEFMKLQMPVPSIEEQTAIVKVLQAADKEIELLKAKTEKLRKQKKGMMQVLLTGKKRLKIN